MVSARRKEIHIGKSPTGIMSTELLPWFHSKSSTQSKYKSFSYSEVWATELAMITDGLSPGGMFPFQRLEILAAYNRSF